MVKWWRSDETDLVSWIIRQGDFIRVHGRFPYVWRTMWFIIVSLLVVSANVLLEFAFYERGLPWPANPVVVLLTITLILQSIQRILRTRLSKVETGLPVAQTAELIESELRRLGYGPMWTDGKGVGIMRLETSTGLGRERHILVIVPDDGRLWITALDAKQPFFVLGRKKPFKRLLAKLREAASGNYREPSTAHSTV